MQIEYTDEFRKCLKKIRDKKLQVKIKKLLRRSSKTQKLANPYNMNLQV